MAWQRKIPFGYQVQNGRINCHPEEAELVRAVFSRYLLGGSYSQIADEMTQQGVRYHQHTAQWNKHMVKRILENERYLGMDGYPQLVTDEEFLAVRLRRGEQNTYAPCPSEIIPIRDKAVCALCGEKMARDTKSRGRPRWRCKNPECGGSVYLDDSIILERVVQKLKVLAHSPECIRLPIPKRSKGVCLMNIQKTAPTPKLVTMIPADPQMTERDLRKKHLRVAPYCRVSTDKEEQLSSYEAQIEYYTEKIDANPDWTMVRLYADEGITGTSAKKRKDFLQMIRDCERGKIDLVITKSVSRFCRNTLDGLNYVRRLKRHGVGVYFEKENVNTLFMDNEMILTFMMSQAQAESESLSGNVRWGHRKNFKDGKVYYHCKTFLGYRWGADGQPEIDPEQAAIVRRIFSRFLLGHSVRQITTDLMADGIKTATGKTVWHDSVVQKMLCNEKYIGDAILQKTYIADLFTREKRVNNGELPKYYVHDCHPAIIDRETFQKVQEELARRSSLKKTSSKAKTQLGKYCGKYVLSELLVCGECGSPYRRVIWTQKGAKRVVWRCQNRLEHGRKICKQSPTLDEGDIHDAVISAMNELFRMQAAKDAVKAGIAAVLAGEEQTMSLPAVELQIRNLQERQLELFQLIVSAGADCTDYDDELQQVNIAKTRLMAQKAELEKEQRGAAAFESRLAELDMALEQASGTLTDFDELTVRQLISNIKVLDKDSLLICFKDGTEITQAMQRRQTA